MICKITNERNWFKPVSTVGDFTNDLEMFGRIYLSNIVFTLINLYLSRNTLT